MLSQVYLRFTTLVINSNPRGLYNEFDYLLKRIKEIDQLNTKEDFYIAYKNVVKERENSSISNLSSFTESHKEVYKEISKTASPQELTKYLHLVFNRQIPSFLMKEKEYVEELINSSSRKQIKKNYFESNIERIENTIKGDWGGRQ